MPRPPIAATAVLLLAAAAPAAEPRPNVLVILTDDLRWDVLGVVQREQGDKALFPWFKTPHIDPAHVGRVKELADLHRRLQREYGAEPDKMPVDGGIKNVLPKF